MSDSETKSHDDRRGVQRHKATLDVNYRHGDTYLFSRSENLSELGIFLVSKELLAIGTHMELKFRPPGGNEEIEIHGEVVWIDQGSERRESGMGVRFTNPDQFTRERIKTLIRTIAYLE
jgi:uncharacterized protein (TIGR02266 family)